MTTHKIVEVDCSTGIETVRDMTDEEVQDMQKRQLDHAEYIQAKEAEELSRALAKASAVSKLTELGLTAEEIAALSN
jgi:hypothetical protein